MRKAKKKMHRMPKLSLLDQAVYWGSLVFLCTIYFVLAFSPWVMRNRISFSDPTVIATMEHVSALWAFLPCLFFFLITFIPWSVFYGDRHPIFGLKNFKYGPPAWPKIYPVFMKNKPYVWVSPRKQAERKLTAVVLIIVLLLSFIPYPWSIYGRSCLHNNGCIQQYTIFNNRKVSFSPQEIEQVEFSVYTYSTGRYSRTKHWDVRVAFKTHTNKEYCFEAKDFRRDKGMHSWLTDLGHLKKFFDPSIIRYHRTDELKWVVWDYELSDSEAALLYQLFGMAPELCTERTYLCMEQF